MKAKITICALALALGTSCIGLKPSLRFPEPIKPTRDVYADTESQKLSTRCDKYMPDIDAYERCMKQYSVKLITLDF